MQEDDPGRNWLVHLEKWLLNGSSNFGILCHMTQFLNSKMSSLLSVGLAPLVAAVLMLTCIFYRFLSVVLSVSV